MAVRSNDSFEVQDFGWGDFGGVDQGQRSIGGLKNLVVAHNGGPLKGQAYISTFPLIESGVDTVLEIARERNLRLFLLFGKHFQTIHCTHGSLSDCD